MNTEVTKKEVNEKEVNMNQNNVKESNMETSKITNSSNPEKVTKPLSAEEKAARRAKREENLKKKSADKRNLADMERQIRRGITCARKIGECLKKIRDNRWYTASSFSTFASYCKHTFDFTSVHAYRLIAYYEVCTEVLGIEEYTKIPERVIRPLTVLVVKNEVTEEEMNDNKKEESKNRDLKNEYLTEAIKSIWSEAMGPIAALQKERKETKGYPDCNDVQKLVDAFLVKEAQKTTPEGHVYVKEIGSIEREKLADTLIDKTKTAQDLLRCFNEVKVEYAAKEYIKIRKECMIRIDKEFRKKEPKEISDSRTKIEKDGTDSQNANDFYDLSIPDIAEELDM